MYSSIINTRTLNTTPGKIFTWFFLVAAILVALTGVIEWAKWSKNAGNYTQVYAYSANGELSYSNNGKTINVTKVFDLNKDIINTNFKDGKTVQLYCEKANLTNCVYLRPENSVDQSALSPLTSLFIGLFLFSLFSVMLHIKRGGGMSFTPLLPFGLCLFIIGVSVIVGQLFDVYNYSVLSAQNNTVQSTIYSEVTTTGQTKTLYKPVAKYSVDGADYIYVSNSFKDGTFLDNEGKNIDLYYDKNNPSKAMTKENPIDVMLLIIGFFLAAIGFPFVFMGKIANRRIKRNAEKAHK